MGWLSKADVLANRQIKAGTMSGPCHEHDLGMHFLILFTQKFFKTFKGDTTQPKPENTISKQISALMFVFHATPSEIGLVQHYVQGIWHSLNEAASSLAQSDIILNSPFYIKEASILGNLQLCKVKRVRNFDIYKNYSRGDLQLCKVTQKRGNYWRETDSCVKL